MKNNKGRGGKMSIWNNYYKRPAFLEGFASAFDLFGSNSNNHSLYAFFTETKA